MQDWPVDLVAETALNPTTLCRLFVITPTLGAVLRFTDHDTDVKIDGDTYGASHSFSCSALQNSIGGSANFELTVLFDDSFIGYGAVMRGLFKGAVVTVYLASYGNLAAGKGILAAGRVGSVSMPSKLYGIISVIGHTGKTDRVLTDVYQWSCRADFGDAQCGKNLADFSATFTVASITDDMLIVTDLADPNGTYNLGSVVWATGDNAGAAQEVAYSLATGAVGLFAPSPYPVEAGDTGTIYRGCAKTLAACAVYYGVPKPANFRGEPFVPGDNFKQVL